MCARLRGGAGGGGRVPIPGGLNCQACDVIGCWPAKPMCFRCGSQRSERRGQWRWRSGARLGSKAIRVNQLAHVRRPVVHGGCLPEATQILSHRVVARSVHHRPDGAADVTLLTALLQTLEVSDRCREPRGVEVCSTGLEENSHF